MPARQKQCKTTEKIVIEKGKNGTICDQNQTEN